MTFDKTNNSNRGARSIDGASRVARMSVLTIASLCTFSAAHAETVSEDTSRTEYEATVYGVPDLDQQRDPVTWDASRNNGRMYCGPASAANLLSYYMHEGYTDVDAPTIDFEPSDSDSLTRWGEARETLKLSAADGFIADLADEMNTGAFSRSSYDELTGIQRMMLGLPVDEDDYSSGTSVSNLVEGLQDRLPSDFSIDSRGGRSCEDGYEYTITPRRIFEELHDGNMVILNIGLYLPNRPSTYLARVSGHYVVVTGVSRTETILGDTVYTLSLPRLESNRRRQDRSECVHERRDRDRALQGWSRRKTARRRDGKS